MASLILPLICAIVYPLATLVIKRALEHGADLWGSLIVNFWTMAAVFLVMLPLDSGPIPWDLWWQPLLVGLISFCGQTLGFKAISSGDLTIATPAMGTKVLLVALFTEVLLGLEVPLGWWVAAVLSFTAVLFLQSGVASRRRGHLATLAYSLLAAGSFALGDVLIQRWAPAWGVFRFVPAFALATAAFSLVLLPFARRPRLRFGKAGWAWMVPGAALMALQSLGITVAIGLFREATLVNIVFSSRGLWNFVLIWIGGSWFGNREMEAGGKVMALRFLGAVLMFAAIVLATLSQ